MPQQEVLELLEKEFLKVYPAWPDVVSWVADLQWTLARNKGVEQNSFSPTETLALDTASLVTEIGHHFGPYQDQECRQLKNVLLDKEHDNTGRVLLAEFYRSGTRGEWQFVETVEYLRTLGALDESNPNFPAVVIPNYVNGQSNCL